MKALELIDVHKSFGSHAALRGVSLDIAQGEVLCLLGASGSGKTTLLRMVAGLERVGAGCIRLHGTTVDAPGAAATPAEQRGLGMVFQDYALWPHLSVLDNVALPMRARHRRDAATQAMDMLCRVGLQEFHHRRPHELSGGQQQRVALARALAVRPRLLLCDEPLSNLDSGLREELRELIGEVVREHDLSALYITHDQREAFALGDRVGVLSQGRLVQCAPARELAAAPCNEQVARLVHALGPWPVAAQNGVAHAPWGPMPRATMPSRNPTDKYSLYLPANALRVVADVLHPGEIALPAQALRCLPGAQGIELHARLHGVDVRLTASAWHEAGREVRLGLDARQALIYRVTPDESAGPGTTNQPTREITS